jgi:hypothetical protein
VKRIVTKYRIFGLVNYLFNTGNISSKIGQKDTDFFRLFFQNLTGHNAIVNCMAANADGVLVSGADNGTMHFWDWKTGYNFQRFQAPVQPGSLDSEAGVFAMTFDQVPILSISTTRECYYRGEVSLYH